MKKEIMSLPAHKFTTENELVRVKDRDGFYMEKDFWKIMFDELDKTSQKDWKKFVKKHDKKYKKKKLKK